MPEAVALRQVEAAALAVGAADSVPDAVAVGVPVREGGPLAQELPLAIVEREEEAVVLEEPVARSDRVGVTEVEPLAVGVPVAKELPEAAAEEVEPLAVGVPVAKELPEGEFVAEGKAAGEREQCGDAEGAALRRGVRRGARRRLR